jgi:hypothetical protein
MEPLRLPAHGLVLTPTPLARQPVSWVVLLHGFPQNCARWTWVLATLAAARSRYPCPGPPGRAVGRAGLAPSGQAVQPAGLLVQVPTLNVSVRVARRFEVLVGAGQMIPSKSATRAWSSEWPDIGLRPRKILPAGAAVTVLIGSRGRTACTRQMLRCRDQAIVPVEYPTSASASVSGRDGGRNQAGSEPGGDPPKPPGAAPPGPSTARGVRNPTALSTSGHRSGRLPVSRPDAIPRRLPCLE